MTLAEVVGRGTRGVHNPERLKVLSGHIDRPKTELVHNTTAALVHQAIDHFMAWKFEAGERLLERALEERRKHEHGPPMSPYFNTCILAIPWTAQRQHLISGIDATHVPCV